MYLFQEKHSIPMAHMESEKKEPLELQNDEDSDLSNDTPLSELIKQETSAKQQRSATSTPKDITSSTEQPDADLQLNAEPKIDETAEVNAEQPSMLDEGDDNANDNDDDGDKVEDTTDLLENQASEHDDYTESAAAQTEQSNEFHVKSPEPADEKPMKIEIDMPIDSFESDSNEEKSMENIKRKIEALPELKDSNSSENSQDETKHENIDTVVIEEELDTETTDVMPDKLSDNAIAEPIEKADAETIAETIDDDTIVDVEPTQQPNEDKDDIIDSISIKDESNDLTMAKDESVEPNESDEVICDTETIESAEPVENDNKTESVGAEPCQVESVESIEEEAKDVPSTVDSTVDSTGVDNAVVEILDDDIIDKDEIMPESNEPKEEIKAEADSSQPETDDLIEIKSDDEKPEPNSPPEIKIETVDEASASKVKTEPEEMATESKQKPATPTPAAVKRKVSSDDELFEDAKETLEIEVKQPKTVTPVITCDTDDDSVIEVAKEEKVKRDYSRRKKDQSHNEKRIEEAPQNDDGGGSISSRLRLKDRDRSESPFIEEDSGEPSAKTKRRYSSTPNIDSLPNSPASSDDREYRSWKKSILLLYSSLAGHRYASIFAKPITDDQAPNYKTVILQPMDLQSLKRNIDSGQIRNTLDFQLYVMRMCYNAIFYNINDDVTCSRAKEMLHDALQLIVEFSVTWKKENEKPSTTSNTNTTNVTKSVRGRKSNRLMN